MRKIIVYCDRCGQQTEKVYHLTATQEKIPDGGELSAPGLSALHGIDLCWNCLNGAVRYTIGDLADYTQATASEAFASTAQSSAAQADPVLIEVDKSAAVATPSADTEDRADTPGAKGKLSDIDPDYLRQLADEGLTPARIRDKIEQDYGIKVGISSVQYRLHKIGL